MSIRDKGYETIGTELRKCREALEASRQRESDARDALKKLNYAAVNAMVEIASHECEQCREAHDILMRSVLPLHDTDGRALAAAPQENTE